MRLEHVLSSSFRWAPDCAAVAACQWLPVEFAHVQLCSSGWAPGLSLTLTPPHKYCSTVGWKGWKSIFWRVRGKVARPTRQLLAAPRLWGSLSSRYCSHLLISRLIRPRGAAPLPSPVRNQKVAIGMTDFQNVRRPDPTIRTFRSRASVHGSGPEIGISN
jgi:hypothetical protein